MAIQTPNGVPPTPAVTTTDAPLGRAEYQLRDIRMSPEEWAGAIRNYPTALVFHDLGWLEYIERTQGGERVLASIEAAGATIGYFCGIVVRKGPFRLLGSPLRGWWTPNMGPVANPAAFDTTAFARALDGWCRAHGIDFLEMCCDWLAPAEMENAGYRSMPETTHSLELGTPDEVWAKMYKTTRNYVRRAEKNGLTVEVASDEQVIHEYYEQLKAVFGRRQLTPPHPLMQPLTMWRCLQPRGKLMVLRALHQGRCIATYLLVWDEQTMWGLGTASLPDSLDLRPNELIHWRAIETASKWGLKRYDLCGGGDYKKKYGALEVPRIRWRKAYTRAASAAYRFYEWYWTARRAASQRTRALLQKFGRKTEEPSD